MSPHNRRSSKNPHFGALENSVTLPPMNKKPMILCFEDDGVAKLFPVVTARPAYAITCASFRLIDWLRLLDGTLLGEIRGHLKEIQRADFAIASPSQESIGPSTAVLLVNARCVPTVSLFAALRQAIQRALPVVFHDQFGAVAAAFLPAGTVNSQQLAPPIAASEVVSQRIAAQSMGTAYPIASAYPIARERAAVLSPLLIAAAEQPRSPTELATFQWPHDIVAHHMRQMNESMQWRIEHETYSQLQDGVFVGKGATLGQYAAVDTQHGPVILDANVQVGPFCYLSGPVYAGRSARVIEHAALKDGVSLGHTVKIGGEVEASVIEPYTNKQHHGFLGHSYLGSWINLGAGTCNSDLKNTYGTINMEYTADRVATDMQFMGCVMGDYSKSAINTGIFTGKVIGVCSMLYGFVTTNVPSFVNYARLFGQTATLPAEVMISTQARMFARRKVEQRECDRQLIFDMFELTEDERTNQAALGL